MGWDQLSPESRGAAIDGIRHLRDTARRQRDLRLRWVADKRAQLDAGGLRRDVRRHVAEDVRRYERDAFLYEWDAIKWDSVLQLLLAAGP